MRAQARTDHRPGRLCGRNRVRRRHGRRRAVSSTGHGEAAAAIAPPRRSPRSRHPACANGVDDDGDGLADIADPDCDSPSDLSEERPNGPAKARPSPTPRRRASPGQGRFEHGVDAADAAATAGSGVNQTSATASEGAASAGGVSAPAPPPATSRRGGPGRRLPVRRRRLPDRRQPDDDDRPLRPGPDRRPQPRHRLLRDPSLPAADLPGLRHRVRDPLGGPRLDQQNRDRLRHQPQRLQRRRDGLDAVHPLELGGLRGRRQRRRPQGPLQPGRRDLRRGQLPEGGGRQREPLRRDLRLQPRRLVRAGGAALRARLRQAARRPGRLADRADRGRPLPGRRRRPLRRRHLRPRGAEAGDAGGARGIRQRRRGDLLLADAARDQHLRRRGGPGGRRQRWRDREDGQLARSWAALSSSRTPTATATPTPSSAEIVRDEPHWS